MKRNIIIVVSIFLLNGCASHLKVYDKQYKELGGIPVNSPRLINIKTTTSYEVRPEYKGNKLKVKLCESTKIEYSHKVLPLGDRHYIGFDPANFGKSEFALSFSDTGILTGVTLNSDPTEALSKATELLTTALPYISAPKSLPEAEDKALRDSPEKPADEDRKLYCLTKKISEEILSPVEVKEEKGKKILKKLERKSSNLQIESKILKTHKLSTSRMQRILEHKYMFQPKIVGGREVEKGDYPWAVSLAYYDENNNLKSFCGGSLINKRWVLTAAHCEVLLSDIAIVGRHDLTTAEGKIYKIKNFIAHEAYDKNTSDNDIALVELDSPVSTIKPLPINTNYKVIAGDNVTVIGWGRLSEGGISSDTLQEVTIPIVANEKCQQSYFPDKITENMLCGGNDQGGKDSCQGDSGGPLLKKIDNAWFQIGVVSFGVGCARPKYYGVYSRVSKFADWIKNNMARI